MGPDDDENVLFTAVYNMVAGLDRTGQYCSSMHGNVRIRRYIHVCIYYMNIEYIYTTRYSE